MRQSIVLLSGGVDSTTALYWAKDRFDKVHALTVDYGQRHKVEIEAAKKTTSLLAIPHRIFRLDLARLSGSALTDRGISLPRVSRREQLGREVPPTYVPFRNGILLSLAAAMAETMRIRHLVCGFNVIDSPHYPDTRRAFVKAMEKAVNRGTRLGLSKSPFKILAPFIKKTKADIIRAGLSLGVDYSLTVSCYAGRTVPCGACSACLLRKEAWQAVGQEDPLVTRMRKEAGHELDA